MSTFGDFDDSFDSELANIDLTPSDPKINKIVIEEINNPVVGTSGTVKKVHKKNCVLVSNKQRGNPLLKSIGEVPYEFEDIVPDYQVGETTCVLYLSLKYHNLNPDYINGRLKQLGHMFELRILLVEVDIPEPHAALKHLTRMCLLADLTLMVAWSSEEAGEIIETYKLYENLPPDMIMERPDQDTHQVIATALTNIKPVNKTDALTLMQTFGTLESLFKSSEDRLSQCAGLGPRKAKKLFKVFNEPFLK